MVQLRSDDCFKCLANFKTIFKNPAVPCPGVSSAASLAAMNLAQGVGSTSTIRWGFNFKRARTVLKQVCNPAVMAVSRSCWRSLNSLLQKVQDSVELGGHPCRQRPRCLSSFQHAFNFGLEALLDLHPARLGDSTEVKVQAEVCPPWMHGLPLLLSERGTQQIIQRRENGLGAAFTGCTICDVSVVEVEGRQDVQQTPSYCFCELRNCVEACHCQRQPKKEAVVGLVGGSGHSWCHQVTTHPDFPPSGIRPILPSSLPGVDFSRSKGVRKDIAAAIGVGWFQRRTENQLVCIRAQGRLSSLGCIIDDSLLA